MALSLASARSGRVVVGRSQATQRRPRVAVCKAQFSRRQALSAAVATVLLVSTPGASEAKKMGEIDLPSKEVDDATSPYIQGLLAKSEAQRENRKKERLDNYYKRNFKEYLQFEAGSREAGKARGISEETNGKILEWLEKNE